MDQKISEDDVRALAAEKSLPLTDAQISHIADAASMLKQCAARLRTALHRNDEPAFGFRHPLATLDKDKA